MIMIMVNFGAFYGSLYGSGFGFFHGDGYILSIL